MVDMSLNIKNEHTHSLVRELATLRGVSQTEAVEEAVSARLSELKNAGVSERRLERTMEISRELGALLRNEEGLSTDDLYDDLGLPQ